MASVVYLWNTFSASRPVGNSNWPAAGNAGRNSIEGPGIRNFDVSLVKNFRTGFLGESGKIQFRSEFFNIFYHPNFNPPTGGALNARTAAGAVNASAGSINSAQDSRQIQFGLKIYY